MNKKIILNLCILLIGICSISLIFSCKKEKDNDVKTDPRLFEYQGVIVGSTGHYTLTVTETGADAIIIFDGLTYHLNVAKKIEKDKDIDSLILTDGNVKMIYSYRYADQLVSVSFIIPGHEVQNTVAIVYDYRHPQLYIDITYPVKLYEGTSNSTFKTSFIDYTYNMSFDMVNKTCKSIEKVTNSSNTSQIGETEITQYAFTETATIITLIANNDSFVLSKSGNDLIHEESGVNNYWLKMELKRVN